MITKIQILLTLGALVTYFPNNVFGADPTPSDHEIVNKLAKGSTAEVDLGKIVQARASAPSVKKFGQRMIDDHNVVLKDTQKWANQNKFSLDVSPPADATEMKTRLSLLNGKTFDREYIIEMLDDHKKEISDLRNYLVAHPDSNIRPMLEKTLPILENHIRVAENVAGQIGVEPGPGLNHPEHPASS